MKMVKDMARCFKFSFFRLVLLVRVVLTAITTITLELLTIPQTN